jgi:hypothetical protein
MAFRQPVCRQEDKDLDTEMAKECEQRLYRRRWVHDILEEDGKSSRLKGELVFMNRTDDMEEVMENDRRDRQSL